jgi:hypothetical protein
MTNLITNNQRKKLGKLTLLFAMFTAFVISKNVVAAEFFYEKATKDSAHSVSIRGPINRGDFDRFKDFLLVPGNLSAYTIRVYLNSPGGDVIEALKFANLFEKSSASTVVGFYSKCYSACFIMFAGGVSRAIYPLGELGVHRISLNKLEFDIQKAKGLLSPISGDVYNYLLEQGIPRPILEKMNETSASDMFVMDVRSIQRSGWSRSISDNPVFFDATEKACGKLPDKYPDKSLSEQPRTEEEKRTLSVWVSCQIDLQLLNTLSFAVSELERVKAGKSSLLFPKGKIKEATLAVNDLRR